MLRPSFLMRRMGSAWVLIGGLDSPTSGEVFVAGRNVSAMPTRERTLLRRSTVSFIFQSFGLIPMLTAAENVGIPLRIIGTPRAAREGQLDSETGRKIMRLLRTVVAADGITAVVATHDPALHELADEVLALEDGRLTQQWPRAAGVVTLVNG
jgi:putative ABC transport system ATP-binding protein